MHTRPKTSQGPSEKRGVGWPASCPAAEPGNPRRQASGWKVKPRGPVTEPGGLRWPHTGPGRPKQKACCRRRPAGRERRPDCPWRKCSHGGGPGSVVQGWGAQAASAASSPPITASWITHLWSWRPGSLRGPREAGRLALDSGLLAAKAKSDSLWITSCIKKKKAV